MIIEKGCMRVLAYASADMHKKERIIKYARLKMKRKFLLKKFKWLTNLKFFNKSELYDLNAWCFIDWNLKGETWFPVFQCGSGGSIEKFNWKNVPIDQKDNPSETRSRATEAIYLQVIAIAFWLYLRNFSTEFFVQSFWDLQLPFCNMVENFIHIKTLSYYIHCPFTEYFCAMASTCFWNINIYHSSRNRSW